MEPVRIPITDSLDLHTFDPRELPELLEDYFTACMEAGIFTVRVIHGKGKGILRSRVHGLLNKSPRVASYQSAPPEAGGWGATLVVLQKNPRD